MSLDRHRAPMPDLRIVFTDSLSPHEEHDSQRAQPLIERLRTDACVINPPVVAPIGSSRFVILDGANRCYAFAALNYPHILVQVASYEDGGVELQTWNHVVSQWNERTFLEKLAELPDIQIVAGQNAGAIAHIRTRDGSLLALCTLVNSVHERNEALRKVVSIYQKNALLHRTALGEPEEIWPLYEEAIALVIFPQYEPADIIAAARYNAYLPPGISRHIVHGRALRVNYPIDRLKDERTRIADKNEELTRWLQRKLEQRQVRYYAESTYQFDE